MQESSQLPEAAVSLTPNRTEMSVDAEVCLEDYLDHLYVPLVLSETAYERRQEMRAEVRAHLLAMVAAYEELGCTSEEALTDALQQFGKAEQVAKEWGNVLSCDTAHSRKHSRILAARYFAGATAILAAVLFGTGSLINHDTYLFFSFYLLLPGATGLGVGLLAPTRPVHATLSALAKLSLPTLTLYLLWGSLTFTMPWQASLFFCAVHAVSWTLVSPATAWIGGFIHRAGRRLRIA